MKRPSFNILGQYLTNDEWSNCLSFMSLYRPTTVGVMDNVQRTYNLLTATEGETLVWHRTWRNDDAYLWRYTTPQEYADEITHHGNLSKDVWVYVLNEPDTTPRDLPLLVRWLVNIGDELAARGYHAVLGNIGSATVLPETIDSGVFDPYLRKLAEWSASGQHVAGWHEYTGILLPFGVGYWPVDYLLDPTKVQLELWPEITYGAIQAQMNVLPEPGHYWHLLRTEWFQARAVAIGAGRFKCIVTEFGWDRMPDMTAAMPNVYQKLEAAYGATRQAEIKGVRTLENVYRAYFPDWSFDRAVYEQLSWADRNYPADYLGFNIFAWVFDKHLDKEQKWE